MLRHLPAWLRLDSSQAENMPPPIRLIATDIDGTLLTSRHELTPRTEAALRAAMDRGVHIVLATGKSFASARSLVARLGLTTPGVYIQGLLVCEADGTPLHTVTLDREVARETAAALAADGFSMVAYCGTRILAPRRDAYTDRLLQYHEPPPEVVGPLADALAHTPTHKLLAIGEPEAISALRRRLEPHLDGRARLVQALHDALEILPPGASKGAGLGWLLGWMGIPPAQVLAIGDGENDVEMLQLAGMGVAVANAMPHALAAADAVVASHDAEGVAEAVQRFVLDRSASGS